MGDGGWGQSSGLRDLVLLTKKMIILYFLIEYLLDTLIISEEHCTVNYTGTLSFITMLSSSLSIKHWVLLLNFSVKTFQPTILTYSWGNFIYHHRICILIYCSLSVLLGSMNNIFLKDVFH